MILEGLVTTVSGEGVLNIAPMGPIVDQGMERLRLRPFKTSQTYRNLRDRGEGVFHVSDDVLLLAQAALGQIDPPPLTIPATQVRGHILQESCRFYEFRVESLDDSTDRCDIAARVVARGRLRDFFGFNRAKHAVVEAAILATRLHLIPKAEVEAEFARLKVLVEKTGGKQEHEAFALLENHLRQWSGGPG
ncbi:MAG: DUF447 family protein [Gemmatales bacterium]|nr:DUF447 family protein [Gemmatales bacterium]MDW8386398.1 DUF447 family protein [Gemmatales bacterium]